MDAAVAARRPWWLELGSVVPRSVRYAAAASRPQLADDVPRLSSNPLTLATVTVDELAMSAAYLLSRRSAAAVTEAAVDDAVEAARRLRELGFVANPALLHPDPTAPSQVRSSRRNRGGLAFEHISFASDYQPPAPLPGVERWRESVRNRTMHAYLLRHGDRPRPWMLVVHGHRMGEPRDLRMLGSPRLSAELGVDVAHVVLPNHGPRGRDGNHPFPGVDPVANLLGMAQSVWDARTLLAWLRAQADQPIGAFGISLGGPVVALLAALDVQLRCVVAGVPTAELSTMLADTMRGHWGEDHVAASHVLDEAPAALSRLVSPLTFAPAVPRENRYLYAAVGDRLVTPQQALSLWRHWDRPEILWLQGGHILNNVRASRRFVCRAMAASGIVARLP